MTSPRLVGVWSPVLVPVDVPDPVGAPTIAALIPLTVPVNVGDANGAFRINSSFNDLKLPSISKFESGAALAVVAPGVDAAVDVR